MSDDSDSSEKSEPVSKQSRKSESYDNSSPSTSSSSKKDLWRKQAFSQSWLSDPDFEGWISNVVNDKYKAKCIPCNKILIAGKS